MLQEHTFRLEPGDPKTIDRGVISRPRNWVSYHWGPTLERSASLAHFDRYITFYI